ncbi:MAG: biotin-dependent carboxyltransferase family protein [Candidatus Binatia bacterium]|nr:biotin-dependent carboxyltransferase family protein [Candidatus Binatia bacterium]
MRLLRIRQPGPRTTVEDLGRRGVARFGVPPGGAFDRIALRAANRLVGNPDHHAGLELTLMGPTIENAGDEPIAAAIVGAPVAGTLVDGEDRSAVPLDRAFVLPPGARLRLAVPLRAGRAWVALAGGVAVPAVLGSRATYVPASFGGVEGRALRAGDELVLGNARAPARSGSWIDPAGGSGEPAVLGLLPGPQRADFPNGVLDALCSANWYVEPTSDRTGVRLAPAEGAATPLKDVPSGIAPEGTTLGAIQVPPNGCPIVLGPDRPITGGYAKPAVVVHAHLGRVARLRPGDAVRFEQTSLATALDLGRAREESLPEVIRG